MRENFLDIKIIAGLMAMRVKADWEKQAPYMAEFREAIKGPRAWIEWEYLYNELMRYAEENPDRRIQDTEFQRPKIP